MDCIFSQEEMADLFCGQIPPAPTDYVLPTSFPDLRKAARISVDLETLDPNIVDYGNGVYRKDGKIVGVAIAAWDSAKVLMHAEYYPIAHKAGPNLDHDKVMQYLRDNLNFFEGELTGANVSLYDGDWLQSEGVRPALAKWRDVQWAEPLIDEMSFTYKLDYLAHKYLNTGKVTNELKELYGPDYIKRFNEVHPGHARKYGIGDVLLPSAILDCQYKELDALGLRKLYETECRLTPFLLYLREQGVRVDMDRAAEVREILAGKRAQAMKEASDACGIPITVDNFNNKKLLEYIFKKLGIPVPKSRDTGELSITDEWLKHLQHPFGKALMGVNKYNKAKNVFVENYIFGCQVDGRVHGEFHPLRKAGDDEENDAGTESGRFSGTNPNLQNIPARDKEIGPLCRSQFVPELGAQWWAADYSQIEYRMLVHMALMRKCKGADIAQRMYIEKPDTDFHQAVADLTGLERKDAKNLNFGLVYGMGIMLLAKNLNLLDDKGKPLPKVTEIMETYHARAPFIKDLYNLCIKDAADDGEIRTILNRRSQFDFWGPRIPRKDAKGKMIGSQALPYNMAIEAYGFDLRRELTHKALNRLLQGSAADLMKAAMVQAWEAGVFSSTKDFTCSLTVHDELDGSIFPSKRGEEAWAELQHIMKTAIPLKVPVLVGAGIANNWAEAK